MTAYYNEFDPFAAGWLRELIKAGVIAPGEVDERSILDVKADDLKGYTQCHFFAGIGGWSAALRLANWPDSRPVWTGSAPCQPFSTAGSKRGIDDERHLAPVWLNLIDQCRPIAIFGEQVEAAIKKHEWLDNVQNALEKSNYAAGEIVLPACGVGSPQIRMRAWIVAKRLDDSNIPRTAIRIPKEAKGQKGKPEINDHASNRLFLPRAGRSGIGGLADVNGHGRDQGGGGQSSTGSHGDGGNGASSGVGNTDSQHPGGNTRTSAGQEGKDDGGAIGNSPSAPGTTDRAGPTYGSWSAPDWLYCRDGKWRPVRPGSFPLAYGVQNRVGKLRGYGNAIVPEVAAQVIGAAMEIFEEFRC